MIKIYVECGTSLQSNSNTGIQRVVRNIVKELNYVEKNLNIEILKVKLLNNKIVPINLIEDNNLNKSIKLILMNKILRLFYKITTFKIIKLINRNKLNKFIRLILENVRNIIINDSRIKIGIEDLISKNNQHEILLLLDSTWNPLIWNSVDKFRESGGHVCAVLYDLIPFYHPETVESFTRFAHTTWWIEAPKHIDSVLCISKTVRNQYLNWQDENKISNKVKSKNVGFFYLGSNFINEDDFISILESESPFYINVGSIEPRKNHQYLLDAFDSLWEKNINISLVIIGKNSWKSEHILKRITNHSLFNQKLFLLRDISDRELFILYKNCSGVIFPSIDEGFGLPIIEAIYCNTSIFCSDIPIFREIADDKASYFSLDNSETLATIILFHNQNNVKLTNISKKNIEVLTWNECAIELFTKLIKIASIK